MSILNQVPASLASLVPIPVSITPANGVYIINPDTEILVEPDTQALCQVGEYLADCLRPGTGYTLPVKSHTTGKTAGNICLSLSGSPADLGSEGYELIIQPQSVKISANQPAGLFYAVQSIRQLLPPAIEFDSTQPGPWELPAATIRDFPRFAWRGFMLDVARHFFDVNTVKQVIDMLASYKLNHLHLHLSDDQGWRVEIKSWHKLTEVGGSTQVGGGSGGYYTQADYADLVAYAQSRFITIVPEIDLPGHTTAALASYPELNCDETAPDLYTGTNVGFSSLCIRKEITYQFIEDVIRELASLTPGDYLHIGGDEAHSTVHEDYLYFIERVQQIVQAHGKRVVGWGEVAQAHLVPGTLVQPWHAGNDPAPALAQGAKLILSPSSRIYLDIKYNEDTELGLNWAGYVNTHIAYDWDPATFLPGVPEESILGVEAPLWTETIQTLADIEYMIFPRLVGLAEIGWSPENRRSWAAYRLRLAEHAPRFQAFGIHYFPDSEVPWIL